jgi:hypothetical protein
MILYHGSDVKVINPEIIKSEKGKDFGCAFYLTPIKDQAERMAKRKQRMNNSDSAIVSVFEFDEKSLNTLKYKSFTNPDLEWLDMIIKCRSNPSFSHDYDIVEGKIADDSVGETVLFVLDGVIKKEDAIERLKFQKINSQIAFCTEKSLTLLMFVESYEVK